MDVETFEKFSSSLPEYINVVYKAKQFYALLDGLSSMQHTAIGLDILYYRAGQLRWHEINPRSTP